MPSTTYLDHTGGKRALELFGNRPEPTTTRDKLLETAIDRFYTHGFHAIGLDQILTEVGVTKTTFYNHFESKDQLILEALERRELWEGKAFLQRATELAGDDARAMLLAMFDVLDEWFNHPDYFGCMFLNVCVEFPLPNDPIHQAGTQNYQQMTTMIAGVAQRAGAEDPDELAEHLTILIQGAFTHRQVRNDNDAAAKARDVAEVIVDRAIHTPD